MELMTWIALGSFVLAITTTSVVVVVGTQKTSFNDAENVEILKENNLIGVNLLGSTKFVVEFVIGGMIVLVLMFCCKQLMGYVLWCCGCRPKQISFAKKIKKILKKAKSDPCISNTEKEFIRSDTRKTLPRNVRFDIPDQDVAETMISPVPFIPAPLVGLPRPPKTSAPDPPRLTQIRPNPDKSALVRLNPH